MSEFVYCYHCRTQHPREEMRLIATKTGKRWRCITSIKAVAQSDRATREAFGRQVTDMNRAQASNLATSQNPSRSTQGHQ